MNFIKLLYGKIELEEMVLDLLLSNLTIKTYLEYLIWKKIKPIEREMIFLEQLKRTWN